MFSLRSAAKQEAFEESIRLKNQFRTLDEDEVEFLDSVLESTRAKEDAVKKETTEQLQLFRRQQEEADKLALKEADTETAVSPEAASPSTSPAIDSQWATNARKRKRAKDNDTIPGIKLRKSSSTSKEPPPVSPQEEAAFASGTPGPSQKTGGPSRNPSDSPRRTQASASSTSVTPKGGPLGLAAYSSDEDAWSSRELSR